MNDADAVPEPSLRAALEALLIIATDPVAEADLAATLEISESEVHRELTDLAEEYRSDGRGFELRQVGSGWRYYTAAACHDIVHSYVTDDRAARLSQPALETLAVIAYRQPVTRGHIAAVRGVNVDGVVRTLLARGLVEQVAVDPITQAGLYGTTEYFLQQAGIRDLSELPEIAPHVPIGEELQEFIDSHE